MSGWNKDLAGCLDDPVVCTCFQDTIFHEQYDIYKVTERYNLGYRREQGRRKPRQPDVTVSMNIATCHSFPAGLVS